MKRRPFLLSWILQTRGTRATANLQVEVMETFLMTDGPCALLVHHANEETRDEFSQWIRANSGAQISLRQADGMRFEGRIFRVNLCFGRGLILTRSPVATKTKDILQIV